LVYILDICGMYHLVKLKIIELINVKV
jgi:hypothetical protein